MKSLSFKETEELLSKYEIPFCPTEMAASKKEARKIAERFGFPIVLKISSSNILHKTDYGFVKTNIKDQEDLKTAWGEIIKSAKRKKAKIEGILVQKQLS